MSISFAETRLTSEHQSRPDIFHFKHVSFQDAKNFTINDPVSGTYILLKKNGDAGFTPTIKHQPGTHTVLYVGMFDHGLSQRLSNPQFGHFTDPKGRLKRQDGTAVTPTDILYTFDDQNFRFGSRKADMPPGDNAGFEELLHYLLCPYFGSGYNKARNNSPFEDAHQVDLKRADDRMIMYRAWRAIQVSAPTGQLASVS